MATYYDPDGLACDAESFDELTEVKLSGGIFTALPGDVIVTYPSGRSRIVDGNVFTSTFTTTPPAKASAPKPPAKKAKKAQKAPAKR